VFVELGRAAVNSRRTDSGGDASAHSP
jgi:hypothetical protein